MGRAFPRLNCEATRSRQCIPASRRPSVRSGLPEMDRPCRLRMRPVSAPCEIATRWRTRKPGNSIGRSSGPKASIRSPALDPDQQLLEAAGGLQPSRSDTTDSTMFSNHCRPSDDGVEAKSGKPPPPEPTSGLVVTDPPLTTGGSVISVPPCARRGGGRRPALE
jgi:hypothetical protein